MADDSPTPSKDADSSSGNTSSNEGGLWQGLKALIFGDESEHSLRKEIEEAIDEYDEEDEDGPDRRRNKQPQRKRISAHDCGSYERLAARSIRKEAFARPCHAFGGVRR